MFDDVGSAPSSTIGAQKMTRSRRGPPFVPAKRPPFPSSGTGDTFTLVEKKREKKEEKKKRQLHNQTKLAL